MTWIRLMRSGLVRVLFVHGLQSRPWNALHYRPVASDKLKVGGFRFLINVHHGQYPVLALGGNGSGFLGMRSAMSQVYAVRTGIQGGENFKLHHYRIVGVTSP